MAMHEYYQTQSPHRNAVQARCHPGRRSGPEWAPTSGIRHRPTSSIFRPREFHPITGMGGGGINTRQKHPPYRGPFPIARTATVQYSPFLSSRAFGLRKYRFSPAPRIIRPALARRAPKRADLCVLPIRPVRCFDVGDIRSDRRGSGQARGLIFRVDRPQPSSPCIP